MSRSMDKLMHEYNQSNDYCVFHNAKLSNQLLFNTNFQKVEYDVS